MRTLAAGLVLLSSFALGAAPPREGANVRASGPTTGTPASSDVAGAQVTVYGASWCSACKSLEAELRERGIPFDVIDVDENPGAYAIAKKATGANVVPITNVVRGPTRSWIVGADADAVERACRGG